VTIKAIFFDAVGTLIHPQPSAAAAYADIGSRFGTRYTRPEISVRFRAAFKREEAIDQANRWRTSERRERERWYNIVSNVLDDVADMESCFDELYRHFARPASWRCDAVMMKLLRDLHKENRKIGLASNYDERLNALIAGFPELQCLAPVVISAEIGWRKPAAEFFAAVCRSVNLPAEHILFVGDDPVNDYQGALAAGMPAILLQDGADAAAILRDCLLSQ